MSVALKGSVELVSVSKLEDGQLAVITGYSAYEGVVVQRIGSRLQAVGKTQGSSWECPGPTFKVRLLKPGDLIEVTGN